jgi:penicillin-binding protein 2
MSSENPRLRLGILGIVIVSLFAALFARLWYLQVMATKQLKLQAQAIQFRDVREEAPRGRIFDRNGIVIVDNRISVVVTVDTTKLPDAKRHETERNAILDRLSVELTRYTQKDVNRQILEARLADKRYSPYTPIPVADDLPKPGLLYLAEHHADFGDAVAVAQTTVRSYPLGRTASHLLGYVGAATQEELDAKAGITQKKYTPGDEIGKTGAERTYEDELRGSPGVRRLEIDASGRTIREVSYSPPVPGNDVYLSIDANVQAITENALHEELINAHNSQNRDKSFNPAPAGSAVILDPNTGQVIAMASYPDYPPSDFTRPIPTDSWDRLNDPANFFPLNNRALQGLYAPGSTFKLVTALAGLRSGVITPATTVNDTGVYVVPGCRSGQCEFINSGRTAHGRVNLPRALTVSSDVYFYQLGGQFWTDRSTYGDAIQDTAKDLGFASETGIPLPGEQTGYVLTPGEKQALHEKYPTAYPNGDWFTGDNVQLAIGQTELVVTPLQLANAYSTLANGGTLYSPNIAIKITKGGTDEVVQTLGPRALHQVAMPAEFRDPIMEGLAGAVNSKDGTAYGAFLNFPNWTVGGKTGTAQVEGKTDTALFVGIAPFEAPRYVGVAVLEESGFGATAAAPVIRRVFQALADPATAPTVGPGGVLSAPLVAVDNSNGSPD